MSALLDKPPYSLRDDTTFLKELTRLTNHHLEGCIEYKNIWRDWENTGKVEDFPFLHVGLFKHLDLKTNNSDIKHERTIHSSSTTGISSRIKTDSHSSKLQLKSTSSIFKDYLGENKRPLIIIDSVKSLYKREITSARVAAAMSLKFLSDEIIFLIKEPNDLDNISWENLDRVLSNEQELLVYGFSWILWKVWTREKIPHKIQHLLENTTITFVHSGGWKKLEAEKVERNIFNDTLLLGAGPKSKVLDYYGLVEQLGLVYPLCEYGYRHIPVWADILIRDSYSFESLINTPGQIQLINTITWGAPYHNVLTEDIGKIIPGKCECGRKGKRFELIGRIPKAEMRGCSNV